MHKTTAAFTVLLITALVVVLTALSPLASRALAETSTPTAVETTDEYAVCSTDAECAQWDAQGYAMPVLTPAADGGEAYVCPQGMGLYDTEDPDMGSYGVVCAPAASFLSYTEV